MSRASERFEKGLYVCQCKASPSARTSTPCGDGRTYVIITSDMNIDDDLLTSGFESSDAWKLWASNTVIVRSGKLHVWNGDHYELDYQHHAWFWRQHVKKFA